MAAMRSIVHLFVQLRHPVAVPVSCQRHYYANLDFQLTDVVSFLQQVIPEGTRLRDLLGMSSLNFVASIASVEVHEEGGLVSKVFYSAATHSLVVHCVTSIHL